MPYPEPVILTQSTRDMSAPYDPHQTAITSEIDCHHCERAANIAPIGKQIKGRWQDREQQEPTPLPHPAYWSIVPPVVVTTGTGTMTMTGTLPPADGRAWVTMPEDDYTAALDAARDEGRRNVRESFEMVYALLKDMVRAYEKKEHVDTKTVREMMREHWLNFDTIDAAPIAPDDKMRHVFSYGSGSVAPGEGFESARGVLGPDEQGRKSEEIIREIRGYDAPTPDRLDAAIAAETQPQMEPLVTVRADQWQSIKDQIYYLTELFQNDPALTDLCELVVQVEQFNVVPARDGDE